MAKELNHLTCSDDQNCIILLTITHDTQMCDTYIL